MRRLSIICLFICQICNAQSPLDHILSQIDGMDSIRANPKFKFECLLTTIDESDGRLSVRSYHIGDSTSYYYPASTVKLPLSLQVLHNYDLEHEYTMEKVRVCGAYDYVDTYRVDSLLKKMLVFSDNPSYNYLFELSGAGGMQTYMNSHAIDGQVSRRLLGCKKRYWRRSNATSLDSISVKRKYKGSFKHGLKAKIGNAHYYSGKFHNKPRNFKDHNYLPLKTDHNLLKRLIFDHASLGITTQEKDSLIRFLSMTPNDYGDTTKVDGHTKYLLIGNDSTNIPKNLTIVNIVGRAYGFMIDHAYVHDLNSNTRFILSAKIYLNDNDVLGDDIYQYNTIGFPLFKTLGKSALEHLQSIPTD